MKRIVLIGAESTGKSTLAQALSGHFGEPWSDEFVRHYVDQLNGDIQLHDLEPIAEGQLAVEDAALAKATRFAIHDTNILSSIIYANYYFDTVIDWINDRFLERDYTLYLLCMPDIAWIADEGQREGPEARDTLHELFKDSLDILQVPYVEIYGCPEKRLMRAAQAIEDIL